MNRKNIENMWLMCDLSFSESNYVPGTHICETEFYRIFMVQHVYVTNECRVVLNTVHSKNSRVKL